MKIIIINGPNINLLKLRKNYQVKSYKSLKKTINSHFKDQKLKIKWFQSNSESKIIKKLQKIAIKDNYYLIINPAALTHTSIAIRDVLELIKKTKVEVHITNINKREEFRKINYIKDVVNKSFIGEKEKSYIKAVNYILEKEGKHVNK